MVTSKIKFKITNLINPQNNLGASSCLGEFVVIGSAA